MNLTPRDDRGISWKQAHPMTAGESNDAARGVRPITTSSTIVIHVFGVEDFQRRSGSGITVEDVRIVAALQATNPNLPLGKDLLGQCKQPDMIKRPVLKEIEVVHPSPEIEENVEGPGW